MNLPIPSHEVSLTVPVLEYGAEECAAFQLTPHSKLSHVPSYPTFQVIPCSKLPDVPSYPAFQVTPHSKLPHIPSYPTFQVTPRSKLPRVPSYPAFQVTPRSKLPHVPSYPAFQVTPRSKLPCLTLLILCILLPKKCRIIAHANRSINSQHSTLQPVVDSA